MYRAGFVRAALAALAVAALPASGAAADDFYKGKTVTVVVATGPGGGYSLIGQIFSKSLGKYIPGNPSVIVQYQEKAGGLAAANYMYNVAASDGTMIALLRNATALGQALDVGGIKYDATKFRWIGSTGPLINVMAARKDSGVTSMADLKEKELIVGSAGVKIDTLYLFPTVMAKMFDIKLKVISGYKGTNDVAGAVDRKEVAGLVQPYTNWEKSHLHKTGTVGYLVQFGYERLKNLPNVPTMVELARNDEERQILRLVSSPSVTGRNFAAPPKVSTERLAILRKAFDQVVKDPEFVTAMTKANLEVEPMSGEALEKLIAEILATPKPLVDRTRRYLGL